MIFRPLNGCRCSFRISQSLFYRIQVFLNFHTTPSVGQFSSSDETQVKKWRSVYDSDVSRSARPGSTKVSRKSSKNKPSVAHDLVEFDHKTVGETISSYGNDWKRALEFFNWVENECRFQHNTDTYNRMIDILGKFFEFELAWDLIKRMAGDGNGNGFSSPDHSTFRIMFKRYVSAHMVEESINTYNRMQEFNLKDETAFLNLIDALCEYKHVIEAEELCMGKNSPFTANTKVYNMILRGWFKMGWWSKCREFWEEMDRKGIDCDLHSYSIYMDILCKSGKPWKTVKLYKEMKKRGIELDVVAYNTVIHAMGLSDGVDVAMRLYREMLDLGCNPNVVTYNTIIKLLCQSGRIREAYKLLDQMPKKGCVPNVITYHCFFGSLNRPKEILKLFDIMIKGGVRPRMDTYVMLMSKFGRWGFLRPVFLVWDKMKEHGCTPDACAYNALIDALVQKGMIEMARKYDEEMMERGLSCKPRRELGTKLLSGGSDGLL
ncbi:PREDICTED: pentatricopeptide repeat-containing protein At1g80550, mitochondrial [Nelumbo nucifera]|uniref:Pentatricopeptide repeat-containing protein At1g80550, mitochondrial n=1 Tax=Nelumbo nucifera TaxID=4432 RepID=A0A1U8A4Z5_NELNU|nr:PREDICTED: pentatricopeptide repeat-containing protein At1g80550, mitochondrial [Nelumbo nucifera]